MFLNITSYAHSSVPIDAFHGRLEAAPKFRDRGGTHGDSSGPNPGAAAAEAPAPPTSLAKSRLSWAESWLQPPHSAGAEGGGIAGPTARPPGVTHGAGESTSNLGRAAAGDPGAEGSEVPGETAVRKSVASSRSLSADGMLLVDLADSTMLASAEHTLPMDDGTTSGAPAAPAHATAKRRPPTSSRTQPRLTTSPSWL